MTTLREARDGHHPDEPAAAYEALLCAAEGGLRDGTQDTPRRAAAAYAYLTSGYEVDVPGLFTHFDADGYDELVMVKAIPFYSLCEHHLLPFHGEAHVGYIPQGRIVGLSKLARLVEAYARRLQVQERLTEQIADAIVTHLEAKGVIVVISAEHLCMAMRGVEKAGTRTITSVVRGAMKDDPRARAEAFSLLER
jgi:GTP cyclohydrolase I